MRGFWIVQGPYPTDVKPSKRWRAEFIPFNRPIFKAGVGWGRTEKEARVKAIRHARLQGGERLKNDDIPSSLPDARIMSIAERELMECLTAEIDAENQELLRNRGNAHPAAVTVSLRP